MNHAPNDILDLEYDGDRTIVFIPSISFDGLTDKYLIGLNCFEERNLYYLACLSNPKTRFIAVLSSTVEDSFIDYCVDHVARARLIDSASLRERFEIVRIPTVSDENLSHALFRQPVVLESLQQRIRRTANPIIDFWLVSPEEIRLATALNCPYYGLPESALQFDNKSNARGLFKEIGLRIPEGEEHIDSPIEAWLALKRLVERTSASEYLIKLNCEEAGKGIAIVDRESILQPFEKFAGLIKAPTGIPVDEFVEALCRQGATVEAFIAASIKACPSVKMEVLADGSVRNLATHDQVLNGLAYSGARFPAAESYRSELIRIGYQVAEAAGQRGARGIVSVDFLATKNSPSEPWTLWGMEINARKGATTHPYYWTRWLTGSDYSVDTGTLTCDAGETVYCASEFFSDPHLHLVPPSLLLSDLRESGLDYNHQERSGVFVHMLSSVRRFSKVGATVIARNSYEVDVLSAAFSARVKRLAERYSFSPPSTNVPA
ncbi:hypothetical protein WJ21_16615 [Burkholderia vietnamiensis]|uniref:peptide ligase PGM1-related protein n=1 Tax=Burkholderia vietnamiensis TaxID=60552 RepID=UPI0007550D4B|nr:peptide ligase PGM1-related protein [Burkholderia vietnamiensis]KVF36238.1 hypothetical protein WJ09_07905 [Burkholderia vietnamiensis]KVF97177.1 hypothetical protein WJ21_16615 [Burkholderia vietnamiensis]